MSVVVILLNFFKLLQLHKFSKNCFDILLNYRDTNNELYNIFNITQ